MHDMRSHRKARTIRDGPINASCEQTQDRYHARQSTYKIL